MSEKLESLVKFIHLHRAKIAVSITAAAMLTLTYLLTIRNARELEGFMKDHNLLEEYHQWLTPEE